MNQDCLRVILDWGGGYEEDECEALEKVGKGHGGGAGWTVEEAPGVVV